MPPRGAGGRPVERSHARRSIFFFPAARREPGPAVGRTGEGLFLGGVPSFFRARQAAWGASRRRVLRRSPFFFSVFASLAEAPALQTAEGGGVQRRQGAFFPFIFPFFPLAWQDRARVELAVKARSSSLGCRPFFFSCQDEKLNAAETRASVAEARVLALDREKARPFFFSGLGGTRKPVLQVDLMKEIASQARFPSFFSPLFGGVFPGQATRVAVLEEALRNEKAWKQGFQARCRASFSFPPPCPPVAPQAEAIALRREVERLQAHPSAVEIDRLRFRARPRRRLRSVAVAEDPLAVVFPLFFSDRSLAGA